MGRLKWSREGSATYIHTKLYLNHASLNSGWKAGFHEGREITYLQEINYLQEIQNITKKKYKWF